MKSLNSIGRRLVEDTRIPTGSNEMKDPNIIKPV